MKIKDLIHLKGEVLIQSVDANNNISTLVEDKNLIVSNGRDNICNFLTRASAGSYIYDIAFGYGGTITGNSNVAISVSPSEKTVISPYSGLVNGIDYSFVGNPVQTPSPRAVFSIIIPATTLPGKTQITALNGQPINELALMLNTSPITTAFAIKRFPSITKSDIISLIITWTIYL